MERLTEVLREVFADPGLTVTDATTAGEVDGWDSLSHVHLITAVELRFGVRLGQRELLALRDVGDLRRAVESKLGA